MATGDSNAWPTLWNIMLLVFLRCTQNIDGAYMSTENVCTGQSLSISCSDNWVIHVLYETYSYSSSSCDAETDPNRCTKTEFLSPLSTSYCNGQSDCSFLVPADKAISSCNQTATALSVKYSCIARSSLINICSNTALKQTQQIYLTTPNFPENDLDIVQCSCNLTGQNITGIALEHLRNPDSSVILTLSINHGTRHINGVHILNTMIFSNVTKMELILNNKVGKQTFKVWMELRGIGMSLKCGHVEPPQISSTMMMIIDPTPSLGTNQNTADIPISTVPSQEPIKQTFSLATNILSKTTDIKSQSNLVKCSSQLQDDCRSEDSSTGWSQFSTSSEWSILLGSVATQTITSMSLNMDTHWSTGQDDSVKTLHQTPSTTVEILATEYTTTTVPSSVRNTSHHRTDQLESTSTDIVLIAIISCLAFLFLVALVTFTVIIWRKANAERLTAVETHIYDAYHHDNGSLDPDPVGADVQADESILI